MTNKVYTGRMKESVLYSELAPGQMYKQAEANDLFMKIRHERFNTSRELNLSTGTYITLDNYKQGTYAVIPLDEGTTVHIDQG